MIPLTLESLVSSHAPRTLVGIHVRTSMQNAVADCTALWERFLPWMQGVSGQGEGGFAGTSYGVSTETDIQNGLFTYWAAIEMRDSFSDPSRWPEGGGVLTLAGGLYVGMCVPSLAELAAAYTHLYGPWAAQQEAYGINWGGMCFERYDERYLKDGSFEVYVPLVEKSGNSPA